MSIAMKCDICDSYFDYDAKKTNNVQFRRMKPGATIYTMEKVDSSYDMCPECHDALKEVIGKRRLEVLKDSMEARNE